MAYSIYKLKFSTGVHFGNDAGATSLDRCGLTMCSDTLFSALCCEGAKCGAVDELYHAFSEGRLNISDALPYYKDELYLPKPILYVERDQGEKSESNESSSKKKALKNLKYIPSSLFEGYIKNLGEDADVKKLDKKFAAQSTITKVAIKGNEQPLPYHIAYNSFFQDCGLYIVLSYASAQDQALFERLLSNLGLSGVGGKQTCGLGKFEFEKAAVPSSLKALLSSNEADYQMLISTALPSEGELEGALQGGWYALVRRGGFIRSSTYAPAQLKKRTIYLLSSGSCLKKRFCGEIFDLSSNGAHKVWRCAKGMFVGVKL